MMRPMASNPDRASSKGRAFRAVVLIALAVLLACALAPGQSFAYFNQVDDKNSAQQDVGTYGDPIAAAEIPDGTYQVVAKTTSRMCVFYDTAFDAATRSDNKELCTLVVGGGSMTATFYMSPAYTHVFMGTGEQAAQLADAAGTGDSAYVKGEAFPVTTSSGTANAYRYTMAIPALNSPITFASYDGGSVGIPNGKWFDRQVVFMPSEELTAAMAGGAAPSEPPASDPGSESTPGTETDPGSESSSGTGRQGDEPNGKDAAPPSGPASTQGPSSAESAAPRLPAGADTAGGGSQDTASGADGEPAQAPAAKSSAKMRGTPISPAAVDAAAFLGEAATVAVADDAAEQASPALAVVLVVAGVALAGALARMAIYHAEKSGRLG